MDLKQEEQKHFKVEAKGSLWEVTLEHGAYSDRSIDYLVFSGNSQEEVWEFLKIYATENLRTLSREEDLQKYLTDFYKLVKQNYNSIIKDTNGDKN